MWGAARSDAGQIAHMRPRDEDLHAAPELGDTPDLGAGRELPLLDFGIVVVRGEHPDDIGSHKYPGGRSEDFRALVQEERKATDRPRIVSESPAVGSRSTFFQMDGSTLVKRSRIIG